MGLFILFWMVCALVSYSGSLAYFQREYTIIAKEKRMADVAFCGTMSTVFGPIALVAGLIPFELYKHGFMLWPDGDDE
ncbi:hypothetical protein [Brucella intermedia]|uniref:hypothetical protein n=1 Tax=Brucella intermedia TaxID=94625 RepID=UPI00224B3303|nr:hypothetical protein [Brucella intermedia]